MVLFHYSCVCVERDFISYGTMVHVETKLGQNGYLCDYLERWWFEPLPVCLISVYYMFLHIGPKARPGRTTHRVAISGVIYTLLATLGIRHVCAPIVVLP